jgi:hypothetical protein
VEVEGTIEQSNTTAIEVAAVSASTTECDAGPYTNKLGSKKAAGRC